MLLLLVEWITSHPYEPRRTKVPERRSSVLQWQTYNER